MNRSAAIAGICGGLLVVSVGVVVRPDTSTSADFPVSATIGSAMPATSASPCRAPTASRANGDKHAAQRSPTGNVSATIPAAAISASDMLPTTLAAGARYTLDVRIAVAGGQSSARACVVVHGAVATMSRAEILTPGRVESIRISVVPAAASESGGAVIVGGQPAHAPAVSSTFLHRVAG